MSFPMNFDLVLANFASTHRLAVYDTCGAYAYGAWQESQLVRREEDISAIVLAMDVPTLEFYKEGNSSSSGITLHTKDTLYFGDVNNTETGPEAGPEARPEATPETGPETGQQSNQQATQQPDQQPDQQPNQQPDQQASQQPYQQPGQQPGQQAGPEAGQQAKQSYVQYQGYLFKVVGTGFMMGNTNFNIYNCLRYLS